MTIPNDQEAINKELSMIVWRLLHALKKASPGHEIISKTREYMIKNNLGGSILRIDNGGSLNFKPGIGERDED